MVEVFNCNISDLAGKQFAPSRYTPQRLRYINCQKLLNQNTLSAIELDSELTSEVVYAAISYPWRGNRLALTLTSTFTVSPRNHDAEGDPISITVLQTAARAAVNLGAGFPWLDRICIMQTGHAD